MTARPQHLRWVGIGVGGVAFLLVALFFLNSQVTRWVSGEGFRNLLDKETSKGLKFEGHFSPLTRVGLLGMHADSFSGVKGKKAILSLEAHDISGWFNPLGMGLRHWELHDIHIRSGTVTIQKTEPTPGEPKGVPPIPWWAIFWPYRVELEDVKVDDADVLFQLREKESGIYHTFLEITPNGRDFEYDGKGGVFRTPLTPQLNLQHVHLLIRKPRLYCPVFVLGDDNRHPDEQLRLNGDAGLQDDKSIHVSAELVSLQVSPWLPEKLRAHILGHADGHLEFHSTGTGIETAEVQGSITIKDAVVHALPAVKEYVKLTGSPDPGDLHLQVCRSDLKMVQGAMTAENLQVACAGVFKVEGTVRIARDGRLGGELRVGLTDAYLRWLPGAETSIFTGREGDYHVAVVHLSGTAKAPQEDLSARVLEEVGKSPGTALKLFFHAL